ncbi:MAG: CHAT domain-containing protein [Streptomyces sp.]|nr:CHAT domain-containing protein [Streptomyces sp.]
MPTRLPVRVVQDPSHGFRLLPHLETRSPDLRVSFDVVSGDRIRARMSGPALPTLRGGEHKADLPVGAAEVRAAAARLCTRWKQVFVDHRSTDADGLPLPGRPLRPFASAADLSGEPERELRRAVAELARGGASLLFDVLLGGQNERVEIFRTYLAMMLASEGLRIRFDSAELHLPWPMLCLKPRHLPEPPAEASGAGGAAPDGGPVGAATRTAPDLDALFALFLGHRHQIEHTGDAYLRVRTPVPAAGPPVVSLNHDTFVGQKTLAPQVAAALRDGTEFTPREKYHDLVRDLAEPDFREQLMYFWGHGQFEPNGAEPAQLVIRLTDQIPFDGGTVRELRAEHLRTGSFHPFVFLNACHAAAVSGPADSAALSRALIEHGAQGVLGPQIEMPQAFAAEYALAFVTRYLGGGTSATAGALALDLARHFAARYRNPLGFAYALHSGMDTHLPPDTEG